MEHCSVTLKPEKTRKKQDLVEILDHSKTNF